MKNKVLLERMLLYIEKIEKFMEGTEGYEEFLDNLMLIDACVMNLGQIVEKANKLDQSFTEKYPEIPWDSLYGLRNRLIHDYEGINFTLLWEMITSHLQPLKMQLQDILK